MGISPFELTRMVPVMRLTLLLFFALAVAHAEEGPSKIKDWNPKIDSGQEEPLIHHNLGRSIRKSGLLRKLALPLLLLLKLKAAVVIPTLFGIVSLVAFKGLWSGMTALTVTAALALRGLIPPPRIIQVPPVQHAVVHDYYSDYYKRADEISRIDDYKYGY